MQAYNNHYKRFKKSYHVQPQLESIAWKGKSIPTVSALVEAMFMAEMKNLLLTAGHDLDIVQLPLTLDVSKGTESYTLMRGEEQILKPGDMMISDQLGIISDVIYGPDRRTQITADTRHAVFTTYCRQGIEGTARGKTFAGYAGLYPGLCSTGQRGAAQSVRLRIQILGYFDFRPAVSRMFCMYSCTLYFMERFWKHLSSSGGIQTTWRKS